MFRPARPRLIFTGADRLGDDLFANCLIPLKPRPVSNLVLQGCGTTVWDRDFPAPPVLVNTHARWQRRRRVAQH